MQVEIESKQVLSGKERLKTAMKDYEKLVEELKPFIKKRKIKTHSSSGQWNVSE